jgi:hypothetical protein
VTADDDGLFPAWYETGNAGDDNGGAEDGSTTKVGMSACCSLEALEERHSQVVPNSSIRAQPHLLQLELNNPLLIWGDGRTLDTHTVLLDGGGSIECNLVVCLVTVWKPQVVVFEVNVEIGRNEAVFDLLPNDARHFVAVELDDGVLDLDLLDGGCHGTVL